MNEAVTAIKEDNKEELEEVREEVTIQQKAAGRQLEDVKQGLAELKERKERDIKGKNEKEQRTGAERKR